MTTSVPNPRVSLLTPSGVGAIAVIRLEGPGAGRLLEGCFRPREDRRFEAEADRICYGAFCDGNDRIDDVLVVTADPGVPAPGDAGAPALSFDICAHGGTRVVERIMVALAARGAEPFDRVHALAGAWPASSTIEQEIWVALAQAKTRRAVRFLLHQRTALVNELQRIAGTLERDGETAVIALRALLARWPANRALVIGATVAISGPPNAGKSTLANRLIGADRSITSPRPGTTLDWVEAETALLGVPVTLIDLPGCDPGSPGDRTGHFTGDLQAVAAQRAGARSAAADFHLRVFDGSLPPPRVDVQPADLNGAAGRGENRPGSLLVLNKSDLGTVWTSDDVAAQPCDGSIRVSALHGTNTDRLACEILRGIGIEGAEETFIGLFTERQVEIARELIGREWNPKCTETMMSALIGRK